MKACIFKIISCTFLLRMRSGSDKSCRENHNTHFLFSNLFSPKKSYHWRDNVEKYSIAEQDTDGSIIRRMLFAFWIIKAANA